LLGDPKLLDVKWGLQFFWGFSASFGVEVEQLQTFHAGQMAPPAPRGDPPPLSLPAHVGEAVGNLGLLALPLAPMGEMGRSPLPGHREAKLEMGPAN